VPRAITIGMTHRRDPIEIGVVGTERGSELLVDGVDSLPFRHHLRRQARHVLTLAAAPARNDQLAQPAARDPLLLPKLARAEIECDFVKLGLDSGAHVTRWVG